ARRCPATRSPGNATRRRSWPPWAYDTPCCDLPPMIITAPRLVTALPGAPVLEPGYVVTAGDRIAGVGQDRPPRPPDLELDSGVLVPGLVDLQVNGYFGVEMQAADPDGWATVIERLPATGCTAFLPTFITAPVRRLAGALGCVSEYLPGR